LSDNNSIKEIFQNNGFQLVNETKKVTQFSKEQIIIYLKKTNKLSIVIDPSIDFSNYGEKFSKFFSPYWNSNMTLFPKKIRFGKNPEHYGISIDLQSLDELNEILNETNPEKSYDNLIKELDEKFSGTPEAIERIIQEIQRPSKLREAIILSRGPSCQICGYPGFEKKGGGVYAETHHMIELNKLAPKTMQSWNILVLCPLCHKKMHYANVTSEFLGDGWKIVLDSNEYIIK
jgi:predicted HNH restriction endonuclease